MIISPPFLPTRNANEPDDAYLNRAMPIAAHGRYPVSDLLGWHGGLHLTAPPGANNTRLPIRAIADGTVIYMRTPTPMPADTGTHALGYNGWTDNGCVVIRHETTIGADGETETTVRFYSIYLHLNNILPAVQPGEVIRRKAEIGRAGMFEGEAGIIHFEIICDDDNLRQLIGRNSGDLDIANDGRTDAVFGQMYFKLPARTQVYPARPALHQTTGAGATALGEELFVGIDYRRGNAYVTTYRRNATTLGNALTEENAEYDLYRDTGQIVTAYRTTRATNVPAHSAVYELLRFGRVLGPDALNPADTPHWRQIRTPAGQGWVNLNATGVTKYSDADAPHWAKWLLLQDYQDGDSRCNLNVIRNLLDADGDGVTTQTEAQSRMRLDAVQQFMRGVVAKFPTEWHRSSVAARWEWLTREGPEGASPNSLSSATYLARDDFPDFQRYAEALCFWEDANLGIEPTHWHFHPVKFIEHFRKCGWLSEKELGRIYTETSRDVRERYRLAINQTTRKYLYTSNAIRMSHFFGQGAVESDSLRDMQEKSMLGRQEGDNWMGTMINPASRVPELDLGHWYGFLETEDDPYFRLNMYNSRGVRIASSYNWRNGNCGGRDGQKFRGRGFKQLTGRYLYSAYWVYRSWLDPNDFDSDWQNDPAYRNKNRQLMRRRPPEIDSPHHITTIPYNCLDSAGWYLIAERPRVMRTIDQDSYNVATTDAQKASERTVITAVTTAINGGENGLPSRITQTRSAKEFFL